MLLTDYKIKHEKAGEKKKRLHESDGLCIDILPTGKKVWRWRYYFNRKPQTFTIGRYPEISIKEARQIRDKNKALVAQGKHPTREKKAALLKALYDGENTFESVARRWLDLKRGQLNEKYSKQRVSRMEQHVFPMIGALPIADITVPEVVSVVEKIASRGTVETAKRMKQLISCIFDYAAQRGMCKYNPAAGLKNILPAAKKRHHPCIHPNEFPQLLLDTQNYKGNDLTRLAVQLLTLSFVRTSELIEAKWDEIDWYESKWSIPKERMKMKRPHVVPLSRQSKQILIEIQNITGGRDYIFFSAASKSGHISNGTILMALRRMGYQGRMTGHGFRTLASTILNEKGYRPDVIERQLSHEDADKIRAAYNRAEYMNERTIMMQDYADLIDAMRGDNVVKFNAKTDKCH